MYAYAALQAEIARLRWDPALAKGWPYELHERKKNRRKLRRNVRRLDRAAQRLVSVADCTTVTAMHALLRVSLPPDTRYTLRPDGSGWWYASHRDPWWTSEQPTRAQAVWDLWQHYYSDGVRHLRVQVGTGKTRLDVFGCAL